MSNEDLNAAIAELDAVLMGSEFEPTWRIVRRHARRVRRVSQTLPRIFGLAQHVTIALARLDSLFPKLEPSLYARASEIRDHLVAIRDAVSTGRDDETKPHLDLEER